MDPFHVFPEKAVTGTGPVAKAFMDLGISSFQAACRWVHELPYGYNSDRDDLMILFKERMGTCTTKHAVIATLAQELGLPVGKRVGIYAMTEEIVTGTDEILRAHGLPYLPMIHCFLESGGLRVDLTEGNRNGKNRPIDRFLHTEPVIPNIPAREEYRLYRRALSADILKRPEFNGIDIQRVLKARELGLKLLKDNLGR
jgi:hypothetical protein